MTLKELRSSKGLTQAQCAKYLGMSARNYQNYEASEANTKTAKYNAIYKKIEAYGEEVTATNSLRNHARFETNVVTGTGLGALVKVADGFEKRDCFAQLEQFINSKASGKICILYGLRRTGKSIMLLQMIRELPFEKTAYIKIKTTDNMSNLSKDLDTLFANGCRYVFIDEITLMEDFINTAALLSDLFATMGMKIVVSGTDSLGFAMANRDELYDRNVTIHTSFIPFKEYWRLLGINSVDKYIEYGGTLKMENMSYDDPDAKLEDVSFRDDESTRKYIDSAISNNIQRTLKNDHYGEYFNQLRELYDKGELTNVINRIVQSLNHKFLLRVVEERFKSSDFGSARDLMLKDRIRHPDKVERSRILSEIDEKALLDRLKKLIDVKEREETTVEITEEHIVKVKKYLHMLDLIVDCTERYESSSQSEYTLFSQPGMRYSLTKALVYALGQDEYFVTRSESDKAYIIEKILYDVKGKMLEDIILLETSKACPRNEDAFKFKFDAGGEYDMVVYDKSSNNCRIYEIKHSDQIVNEQTRHLRNEEFNAIIEHRFGKIVGKYVIYKGESATVDGIEYVNAEEYLKNL